MNEMQELVEAYEKFKEVDKNFMVGMKAKNFNVDQKLLAFVFQQMQGCTLGEFREFARAIDATAMRIIEGVPIAYTPVADGELQRVATIVNDMIDRAAEKNRQIQNSSCNAPQCAALCKIFFYCKIIIDPRCFLFFGFGVMLHLRLKSLTPGFLCSETISSATSVSVYPRIRAFVFRTSLCAHTSRKTAATSSAVT